MLIFLSITTLLLLTAVVLLIWYIKKMLTKLLFISDNSDILLNDLSNFAEHTEIVYNMDTFFGDEVLFNLLNHAKDIVKKVRNYTEIYAIDDNTTTADEEEEETG